ncbi:MAG: hypothetical protein A3D31_11180 [Candidatus Fluviicola riflensis]|nr:MAG: hypothetical protein CHH17_15600 [Candidatus Fluviicola riflensis]OGS77553.1 MAG: hypothetical protein A3D31_11180 [Candidatus Fluviicola riflensis]OGS84134.1 MAG: hypothetical protein A3E30_12580 [Fluviicola sp. RIFCSPHIGHO2_12_FULL_43_24]OGS84619.1 MAG: hypothetical protein A2724_08115 [Fluviicola sp. RIFCSPHIGHO2_01_FULL_43_53]
MNLRLIFIVCLLGVAFTGCWIDEVQPSQKKSLCIVADHLSKEDSLIINQFGYNYKVSIRKEVLKPEAILQRVRSEKYNAEIDILIIESAELRKELSNLSAFKSIRSSEIFGQLERQFNNTHHQWIPVCHDPLIVCKSKDSLQNCGPLNLQKTDLLPKLIIRSKHEEYRDLLSGTKFNWLNATPGATQQFGKERIYALSDFVDRTFYANDSTAGIIPNECRYYLIDKKRTVSRMCTLSLYRYGRNSAVASNFLSFYMANSYSVANGRNQLPVKKHVTPNWYIRSLSIQ